jgi:hypothetical protein
MDLSGNAQTAPAHPTIAAPPVAGELVTQCHVPGDVSRAVLPVGTNLCFCVTCGEYFYSVKGFDKHRVGDLPARCLSAAEMVEKGMSRNAKGQWITAVYTGPYAADGADDDE